MHFISEKQGARLGWRTRAFTGAAMALGLTLSIASISSLSAQAPDNTKTNQQDRAKGSMTADQQAENPADREISQKVRKALMDDKDLSTYAHNIKVVTRDGVVTLRGPVRTEEEKAAIEAKAVAVAGPSNVKNELTVKPKS